MIEWLARLTLALLALQALALLVRFVGWLDSFVGGRRRRVVAENRPENYALWALAVVVVAVSSAVASWLVH